MSATLETQADPAGGQLQTARWELAPRIAFRFCFLYFGLYCLFTQIFGGLVPVAAAVLRNPGTLLPFRAIVIWTARNVFRYTQAVVYTGSGSGDKVFDWVQAFCFLAVALAGTCIWSAVDRRRAHYDSLYKWFRVFIRLALAGQLFGYGMVKVIPLQMSFPSLGKLLERFGDFSPMGVLWMSVGASPPYERFVGSAELLAGLLLVIPATTMLGALICLINMTEVFALNMTYDVPVKLFSFHMILMATFLLIPERSRLVQFCLRDCTVGRPPAFRLFAGERANRVAVAAQIAYGLLLFGVTVYGVLQFRPKTKSPLYGIWNVDEMSIDGTVRSPLLTDYGRWRRLVFDSPQGMMFERMDDSFGGFAVSFDEKRSVLTLKKPADPKWKGELTVHRQGGGRLTLDGQLGQQKTHMQVSLMDRNKFLLIGRGFHWIQDYPFNR